jgi:hypothetical protein
VLAPTVAGKAAKPHATKSNAGNNPSISANDRWTMLMEQAHKEFYADNYDAAVRLCLKARWVCRDIPNNQEKLRSTLRLLANAQHNTGHPAKDPRVLVRAHGGRQPNTMGPSSIPTLKIERKGRILSKWRPKNYEFPAPPQVHSCGVAEVDTWGVSGIKTPRHGMQGGAPNNSFGSLPTNQVGNIGPYRKTVVAKIKEDCFCSKNADRLPEELEVIITIARDGRVLSVKDITNYNDRRSAARKKSVEKVLRCLEALTFDPLPEWFGGESLPFRVDLKNSLFRSSKR